MPKIAETDQEIMDCFDVMSELRPHVHRFDFLPLVRHMQSEGYRMAYIEGEGRVVAVAGFRTSTNFHLGRHLYVEDLVTASDVRSQGYGDRFIAWLRELARSEGCDYLDLSSGTQRAGAHKFYFTRGFNIASYHFTEKLGTG